MEAEHDNILVTKGSAMSNTSNTNYDNEAAANTFSRAVRSDVRHQYIFSRIRDFFSVGDATKAEELSRQCAVNFTDGSSNFMVLHDFLEGTGANTLLFIYQPLTTYTKNNSTRDNAAPTFMQLDKVVSSNTNNNNNINNINTSTNINDDGEKDGKATETANPFTSKEDDVLQIINPLQSHCITHIVKRCVYLTRTPNGRAINSKDGAQVVQDVAMGMLQGDVVMSFEHLLTEVYTPLFNRMRAWGKNSP